MSCNVNINEILNISKDKQSAFDWNTILSCMSSNVNINEILNISKDKQSTFDWNTILYKNVLSKDMRDLGKVVAMDCDSIIISRESRYRIPISRIERFDGNNVLVDFIYNDLLLIELASLSYSIASSTR